ncbi:MAG: ribonuclease III [Marinilabiliaceae bacterium]|nr:ribonuclease III [Marinilabiliaceae bacterium]
MKAIQDRIKLSPNKRRKFYFFIHRLTGFWPNPFKLKFYEIAFTHKSTNKTENNERLEFLGDAILNASIAEILFKKFPDFQEGMLSKIRADLARRELLNTIAEDLGIIKWINCSHRINVSQTHIPGDVVEAIIGAISITKGQKQAFRFIENRIANSQNINNSIETINSISKNYKSQIIEYSQKSKEEIHFETSSQHGNDKQNTFSSIVTLNMHIVGHGEGKTKKEAEQVASLDALLKMPIRNKES